MDIAAFKVSHSVGIDIDASTALRAVRARSSSIGAMEKMWRQRWTRVQGEFKGEHT